MADATWKISLSFKRLDEKAVLPAYAKPGDAGLDLTATSQRVDRDHGYIEYGTGLAVEIPEGFVGLIFPRSSVSSKDLHLCNSVGVIDSGYRGEIKLRFKSNSSSLSLRVYSVGEKVGQLIVMPVPVAAVGWADELSSTDRGEGGFGSTGQ